MTKYYVSIPSVSKFTIEKDSVSEVIDYMYENYPLEGYEMKLESKYTTFFITTYDNQPYQTQCSISLEDAIDLNEWYDN